MEAKGGAVGIIPTRTCWIVAVASATEARNMPKIGANCEDPGSRDASLTGSMARTWKQWEDGNLRAVVWPSFLAKVCFKFDSACKKISMTTWPGDGLESVCICTNGSQAWFPAGSLRSLAPMILASFDPAVRYWRCACCKGVHRSRAPVFSICHWRT